MSFVISAVLTGLAAALVGHAFHSAVAGFAALVVFSVAVIAVSLRRRRGAPVPAAPGE